MLSAPTSCHSQGQHQKHSVILPPSGLRSWKKEFQTWFTITSIHQYEFPDLFPWQCTIQTCHTEKAVLLASRSQTVGHLKHSHYFSDTSLILLLESTIASLKSVPTNNCEFDLLFYNSQSQANWSRKNGRALPAVHGEISNTEIWLIIPDCLELLVMNVDLKLLTI
jgi:hypothetical protein